MEKLYLPLLLIIILGCEQDKFQMVKGGDGRTYRLNKRSGEMSLINENEIIPLETPQSKEMKQILDTTLEDPIDWGAIQIPGKNLNVKLITSWREGKLYYQFIVSPYASLEGIYNKKENEPSYGLNYGFTMELVDKNGFVIKSIPISLWFMTKTVNNIGEPIQVSINSNIELSSSEYKAITSYTPIWSLDMELIPSEAKISDVSMPSFLPGGTSYHIQQIVLNKEKEAKEALIRLLQGVSFEDVARESSISKEIERVLSLPLKDKIFNDVVLALPIGKISHFFKGEDGKYYIIKINKR